jgi:hypothetical protein
LWAKKIAVGVSLTDCTEHLSPPVFFETECVHVFLLFGDLVDARKDNHVMVVNACAMARSRRDDSVVAINPVPCAVCQVKAPQIIEFSVVFVFAAKDIHLSVVNTS